MYESFQPPLVAVASMAAAAVAAAVAAVAVAAAAVAVAAAVAERAPGGAGPNAEPRGGPFELPQDG